MKQRINRLVLLLCCLWAFSVQAAEPGSWSNFVDNFISPDGRVIDFMQDGISHSEGQGYSMLLAVAHQDKKTFELLWQWTRTHLQVRGADALSAWSWGKRPTGELAPIDYNNASDGDICIAWALLQAHEKWNRSDYLDEATRIITSIRRFLVLERHGSTVLLPGYYGFTTSEGVTLNPSYWILPAFRLFGRYDDRLHWQRVHGDALKMLQDLSSQGLPMIPDWLLLSKAGLSFHPAKPAVFGFEAIRVVLYLAWDGDLTKVPVVVKLLGQVEQTGRVPLSIDLKQGLAAQEDGSAGFYGVMARAAMSLARPELARDLWLRAEEKLQYEEHDYYSHVLYLFSRMKIAR